jgi:hypothetical protein
MKLNDLKAGVGIIQFTEGYWRQRIAKDIVAFSDYIDNRSSDYYQALEQSAAIARGEVK